MMGSYVYRYALYGFITCLMLGCAGAVQVPEDSFYRLEVVSPTPRQQPIFPGTVLVEVQAVAPIYRDRSLLYSDRVAPIRLRRWHYRHWVDSPPRMLQWAMAKYIEDSGVVARVVTAEDRIPAERTLSIEIERFEYVRADAGGQVIVQARIAIHAGKDKGYSVRYTEQYLEPVAANAPFESIILAYQRNVNQLYARAAAILQASLVAEPVAVSR